jgi:hypothetical protein
VNTLRIGLCGPHGVGKTTLLAELRKVPEFSDIEFLPEITRTIKNQGYIINESGTLETQILVMNAHMNNLLCYKRFIVDRCLVDGASYTQFLSEQNSIPGWFTLYAERLFAEYLPMYNYIFYIPPEFGMESDGVRSGDPYFYTRIREIFVDRIAYIKKQLPNVHLIEITGTVAERVQKVISTLREEDNERF